MPLGAAHEPPAGQLGLPCLWTGLPARGRARDGITVGGCHRPENIDFRCRRVPGDIAIPCPAQTRCRGHGRCLRSPRPRPRPPGRSEDHPALRRSPHSTGSRRSSGRSRTWSTPTSSGSGNCSPKRAAGSSPWNWWRASTSLLMFVPRNGTPMRPPSRASAQRPTTTQGPKPGKTTEPGSDAVQSWNPANSDGTASSNHETRAMHHGRQRAAIQVRFS